MPRETAPCRCDHTGAAHSISWAPVPTCQVVWCTCVRYRPTDTSVLERAAAWWAWHQLMCQWRRDHPHQHRLGR